MVILNYRKRAIVIALFIIFLSFAVPSHAENVTFVKEYTYQASELDSKASCRTISLEMVKRLLLEEFGTYLISETEVKDFKLTKEQVTVLTAGIVGVEIVAEKWDGKTYWLKAKVSADPKEVAKSLDNLRKDYGKIKEIEASLRDANKRADEALKEIEQLKKEVGRLKAGKQVANRYKKATDRLRAKSWLNKGIELGIAQKHEDALNAFAKAIELDPQYAAAYYNRGLAYAHIGDYQQAIKDYNKAIELKPDLAEAYYNRGNAYNKLGNYQKAIKDFDNVIELNPQDAGAYYNRGIAYHNVGNIKKAMKDYKTAAKLGWTDAQDYLTSNGIEW